MDIVVSGRNVAVEDSVRAAIGQKVGTLDRFLNGLDSAHVVFKEEKNPRIADKEHVEVTVEGHGHHIRAKGHAADQLTAVEIAVAKLEKQLRKLKTRVVKRHRPNLHRSDSHHPLQQVLDGAPVDDLPVTDPPPADDGADGDGPADDGAAAAEHEPQLVRTKSIELAPMTVDDAMLRMEMLGHGFFLFCNRDTGHASVVYERDDGDIGLIEGLDSDRC